MKLKAPTILIIQINTAGAKVKTGLVLRMAIATTVARRVTPTAHIGPDKILL